MRHFARLAGLLLLAAAAGRLAVAAPMDGQVVMDPDNFGQIRRVGGGNVYLAGPGDPEAFLYLGTRQPDDTRDGPQHAQIDTMITHGGNALYILSMRCCGGDGPADQNPGIGGVLSAGLSDATLDQWDEWLTRMDENEILTWFFLFDDGTRPWGNAGDAVPDGEREYFEAIVSRFAHLKNVIWIVSEEADLTFTPGRQVNQAAAIKAADPHGHPVALHHFQGRGTSLDCNGLFTEDTAGIDIHALGYSVTATGCRDLPPHEFVVKNYWDGQASGYGVVLAELVSTVRWGRDPGRYPIADFRMLHWDVAMGGGAGHLILYEGGRGNQLPPDDKLEALRVQQLFFESTDFATMQPADDLAREETTWVLANPGTSYIAYAETAVTSMGLGDLTAGVYDLRWLDCVTGDEVLETNVNLPDGDASFPVPAALGTQLAFWLGPAADLDADGVANVIDNCPEIANDDQADADGDGGGDVCDPCVLDPLDDAEGDGWCADVDNCPEASNPVQSDWDMDGAGDACDPCRYDPLDDGDGDGFCASFDNCPEMPNPLQVDLDGDAAGDECDPCPLDALDDGDGDGLCADVDNCPEIDNAAQEDLDDDAIGDACDLDLDGDGHLNDVDCAPREPGDGQAASPAELLRVARSDDDLMLDWRPPLTGFSDPAAVHVVLHGDLGLLRSTRGFDDSCLTRSGHGAVHVALGGATGATDDYFLVLAENDCGLGSLLPVVPGRETIPLESLPPCP
ncbi:MAG: thrombospondin type 3 repeat-containing protein [Acidobacteriota bacterium]